MQLLFRLPAFATGVICGIRSCIFNFAVIEYLKLSIVDVCLWLRKKDRQDVQEL